MRLLVLAALALVLASPAQGRDDRPLDPSPTVWRGVQMGPEQVYEGDYAVDYQTSVLRTGDETVWLSGWPDRPGDNGGLTRRYHIRFVGRHTLQSGKFGSLGAYPHTILLTRLISARLLIGQSGGTVLKP